MKIITIKIDEKLYEELMTKAKEEGLLSVSEYIKVLLMRELGKTKHVEPEAKAGVSVDKLIQLLERRLLDKVNPFTSKVDELARKYGELVEKIEAVEEKLKELEEKMSVQQIRKPERVSQGEKQERRKSAIEILHEQKVIFERDIASRIRDRESFFSKLQREGAKIIEARDERIVVEQAFWNEFAKKVSDLSSQNEDEIRKVLDDIEFRLFKKLKESALLIYNNFTKRWQLVM
jgi:vacuolar-type H+-ATPase subunit I/STV1|uniref:Ribbon-helix-helix protein, CopG family n=1 Tax=Ignisphaera aggregans TaxID=334771 RepID=A0A7J3Z6D9_9CREN